MGRRLVGLVEVVGLLALQDGHQLLVLAAILVLVLELLRRLLLIWDGEAHEDGGHRGVELLGIPLATLAVIAREPLALDLLRASSR